LPGRGQPWVFSILAALVALVATWLGMPAAQAAEGRNLLRNPGFEKPLAAPWHKRTPEDAARRLSRDEQVARTGQAAALLENIRSTYTRLRQGHDRTIVVEPDSLIELRAWAKAELDPPGKVNVQIYCMSADDKILAQPTSKPLSAKGQWARLRTTAVVPQDTAYVMAYLQVREGVGRVWFDDVELRVLRKIEPLPPLPPVALFTDLPAESEPVVSLNSLYEGSVRVVAAEDAEQSLRDAAGAIVLFQQERVPTGILDEVAGYAEAGGAVFMEVRNFAAWQGTKTEFAPVDFRQDRGEKPTVEQRMQAGLRVRKASPITGGFAPGQIMPRASDPEGRLHLLPAGFSAESLDVVAVGPKGRAGMVRMSLGRGQIVAADVLSLREPYCRHVGAYYKYTPVAAALGNPVRFGEYFPRRLSYEAFVGRMRDTADEFPEVELREEGTASNGARIYSLNLGRRGAPLYFLYAAAHGSEWEPGYGLLTFARRLAEGRMNDVVDLTRVRVKIVPCFNPWGYENFKRQNANGVDLNRQGDHRWEEYQGRDSNGDGQYAPFDYDYKGSGPFTEPEAKTYQAIIERAENLYCVLDYHGNSTSTSNRVAILPVVAKQDNHLRAMDLQRLANRRLRGRHALRQNREDTVSPYTLRDIHQGGAVPFLMNTSMAGRYGVLIELTAGYPSTYGTVLQTDVTCELCRALFEAYPPPD
jgi:hypothetical protein